MDWFKARRDLALSFAAQAAYKLLGFAVLAILARRLAPAEFGAFLFASAAAGALALVTDLGTSGYLVREVAADPRRAAERFAEVLHARFLLLGLYVALAAGFFLLLKPDILLAGLLSAAYVGLRELYAGHAALFAALKRVGYTVIVFGGGLLLLVLGVAVAAAVGGGLIAFLACHVLWSAALVVAASLLARRALGRPPPAPAPVAVRRALRASLPFFAAGALAVLHLSLGTIILGLLKPYAVVAMYDAPAKLLEATQFLVRPAGLVLFPLAAELASGGRWRDLDLFSRRTVLAALGLGLAVAAVLAAGAGLIVPGVFGAGYGAAAGVLRVLSLAVPGLYATSVGLFLAQSARREWTAAGALAGAVAANAALSLLWIPAHGAVGAAWAAAASHTIAAACLVIPLAGAAARRAGSPLAPPAGLPGVRSGGTGVA